ncbi:MAG: acetate kinase [Bacteroidales bacterium]|jgi:acetate kinase|nr:acetate kinase [Bacteroidales bacterium]
MKILVLNCGSSSIKYQLIEMGENTNVLAKGLLERIGLEMGEFTHRPTGKDKVYKKLPIPNHKEGINMILQSLTSSECGVIKSLDEIDACGHRVAHGGEVFKQSVIVGAKEKEQIRELFALAPLHNPANLGGIEAMEALLPSVPQIAVFDTSFHQTMPAEAYLYAIPYEYYLTDKVRRYGFHGTSHRFVAPKAAKIAGIDINNSRIISCHLGSGASVCAVRNGKSVDTSMGFTPVEGLIMGSRCGDLDLGVLLYIAEKEKMSIADMNNFINKKCGLGAITGGSVDMRDIIAGKQAGKERETYAFDMFAYRVKKYIGAYAAAMGGVDLILFTGGIGENATLQREAICNGLEFLGAEIDNKQNEAMAGKDGIISKSSSRVKILSVTTDEELVIATDTYALIKR